MEPREFLRRNKVFRIDEFDAETGLQGRSRQSALAYHRKRGHLLPIRRGLYWVVPAGSTPENCPIDPFLVAGRVSRGATIAYHSAMELHGRAYSQFSEIQFFTETAIRPFDFRGTHYRPLRTPPALVRNKQQNLGVVWLDRGGQRIRLTSLERCLVDLLDRPDLGGGWEEIWRSLETVEYLDLRQVLEYVAALQNATTAAKTGWYLESQQQRLMVDDEVLDRLRAQRPTSPHYVTHNRHEPVRFISQWNLVIPASLAEQSWEEPA